MLADFLFDQLMKDEGPGALDHLLDYRAERQSWKDKIAENKAKLERCGKCSDRAKIEKELAKWQQTEAQFQQFAGAAFAAVGMPKNIAKFLDIDIPMAPHDSAALKQQYEVVKPAWAKDRPDYCQVAVDTHLQCLRDFQKKTGTPITDVAKTPGGACYDTRKLFLHCGNKNYQAFQMEKNLQALRASGKIIPEYTNLGQYLQVYYGPVPDNFVPSLPPEVVLAKFKEDKSSGIIRLTTRKKGIDVVGTVTIQSFFWNGVVPSSKCFSGQKPRSEIERRICDDLSTLSFKERPPILSCQYTEPGLMASDPFEGSLYWYGSRATYVDPKRLLSRASNHPVLTVGEPRIKCPLTRREADQSKSEWAAKVARLRTETPQIDEKTALPESEWRKQQQEEYKARHEGSEQLREATKAFSYEGMYSFETRIDGITTSGECAVSYGDSGANGYLLSCRHQGGDITGMAGRPASGHLQVRWQLGPRPVVINYQVDQSDPNALVGADSHNKTTTGRLVRMRDLVRLAEIPLKGTYSFEASIKGATESGQCRITTDDRLRPPPFKFECMTKGGQSFSNTAQNRDNAIFVSWPPLKGSALHGLVFVVDGRPNNSSKGPISLLGRNRDGASVRLFKVGNPLSDTLPAPQVARTEEQTSSSGGGVQESPAERKQPGPIARSPQEAQAMYAEGVKAYGAGDRSRAQELFDEACKAGNRSGCARLRTMAKTNQTEPQETKRTPEVIAKPQNIPSPPVAKPPPDSAAPRQRCTLEQIAGTYQTAYGPLVCKPADGALDCCYGPRCEKKAKLAFDESGQNMVGTWSYPDGQHGPITFPVSFHCALQSGRWGTAGQHLNRAWTVGRR